MTAEQAAAIHKRATDHWGRKPPPELAESVKMLSTLTQQMKPTAELGPRLTDAAIAVSRRLRKEKP